MSSSSSVAEPGGVGRLTIVGTPLGHLGDLTPRVAEVLAETDVVAAEDTRRARKLLSHLGIRGKRLIAVHRHNERQQAARVVELLQAGRNVAYLSDAGMPTVSDPGCLLVEAVAAHALPVTVVPGPDAVTTALALSGFDAGRFRFEGFLPRKGSARAEILAELAAAPMPTVIFEAPHRLRATLADLSAVLAPDRPVCVANDLTKRFEATVRCPAAELLARVAEPRGEYVIVVDAAAG